MDGTLAVTGEGDDTAGDGPWWFGGVEGLTAEFFKGTIDEVRIYNIRLSDAEISTLATPPVQAPPLKIVLSANGIVVSWLRSELFPPAFFLFRNSLASYPMIHAGKANPEK